MVRIPVVPKARSIDPYTQTPWPFRKFFQTVPGGRLCQRHQGTLHDLFPTSAVVASSAEKRKLEKLEQSQWFWGLFLLDWAYLYLWGCIIAVSEMFYLSDLRDHWLKILRSSVPILIVCNSNCSSSLLAHSSVPNYLKKKKCLGAVSSTMSRGPFG